MTTTSRRLAGVWMLLLATVVCGPVHAGDPLSDDLRPEPSLTPQQVVRIQLEALRRNDADDRGIAVAFRFASPANRRVTGPVPRFARMIKQGPYALMLRYSHASFEPVEVSGHAALQAVTLIAPGHEPVTYLFHLSRQRGEGPNSNCWMTEGVQVRPAKGTSV